MRLAAYTDSGRRKKPMGMSRRVISHMLRPKSHETASPEKLYYRVCVMGSAAVGKSCIISRFMSDTFDSSYRPTMGDFHRQIFSQPDGTQFVLDIIDMSGKDWLRRLAIASSDGFVLVYAADNPASFEHVIDLRQQIIDEKGSADTPIVVVRNKCDTPAEMDVVMRVRCIVQVDWNIGYIPASAKEGDNIALIFDEIIAKAGVDVKLGSNVACTEFNREQGVRNLSCCAIS